MWMISVCFHRSNEKKICYELLFFLCVTARALFSEQTFSGTKAFYPADLFLKQTYCSMFCGCPTETISLSIQPLQQNVQSSNSDIPWYFYKMMKNTLTGEESEPCYFSFDKRLNLNSSSLWRWLFPCWHGEPSALRRCTTVQQTWSRTSLKSLHLRFPCPQMLLDHIDAGWPTRTGSVFKESYRNS